MQLYLIAQRNFLTFLRSLTVDYRLYILKEIKRLYPKGDGYLNEKAYIWDRFLTDTTNNADIVYEGYRATTPIKSFFSKAYEKVAAFPNDKASIPEKPYCIVGVKSCDLRSFITEDHVFLKGDYVDPAYRFYRDNNLIISSDCSNFKSVCYCLHLNISPYPKDGFDLNISQIDNSFIVEVGSEKGAILIDKKKTLFQNVREDQIKKRDKKRQELISRLQDNIDKLRMPSAERWSQLIRQRYESNLWNQTAATCVECGACTQICPTCHCFLLGDQKASFGYERFKIWDSCQYNGFARVAGGATPRPKRYQRLRNRYVKKFDYFPTIMDKMACTGCGRCIEACPGKIDMRKVFSDLEKI
jgi:ferredoxin